MIDALVWATQREALALAQELITYLGRTWSDYFLGRIWISALALAALADTAEACRLAGSPVEDVLAQGDTLLAEAETTAQRGRPRGGQLGPEGIAWLVRARAEHSRSREPTSRPSGPSPPRRSTTATATRSPAPGGAGHSPPRGR
ncbi:hypothetical protein NKG05_14080 [Oerskovia sp. M15]